MLLTEDRRSAEEFNFKRRAAQAWKCCVLQLHPHDSAMRAIKVLLVCHQREERRD